MSRGITAAQTVSVTGVSAGPWLGEIDLTIDAAGDLLKIDAAGDVLMVRAAITWTGVSASAVAADFSNSLESEPWIALATEDGRTLATEGA